MAKKPLPTKGPTRKPVTPRLRVVEEPAPIVEAVVETVAATEAAERPQVTPTDEPPAVDEAAATAPALVTATDGGPSLWREELAKLPPDVPRGRTPAEDAADAFWASPDRRPVSAAVAAAASLTPVHAPRPLPPPGGGGGGGGGPRTDDREEFGGRRRRRRRRRGRVLTELPIDSPEMAEIVQKLRRQFGLREFRPGQERIIRNVLAAKDTLAVMPTGSGKSLTFQLPAMVMEGVTLVVSPLLALMKDQTDKLRKRGVDAARLDSTLTAKGERETLAKIEMGEHQLVYVTPERVGSVDFKSELGGKPVSLFVIDEAHCVSQWGHDFRPAYLNLRRGIEELGRPPILALTATATPRVVEDIKERLGMKEPELVHLGFARPELQFEVRAVEGWKAQVRRLLRLVRRIRGCGIIYCSTIMTVDALSGALNRLGLRVGKYHGKMTKQERDYEQQRFMKNQVRVIVATNAFGLGVDKPDIRFVIHYNLPGSIEQYYQEAGRSGRDGKPARCILLWCPGDEEVQKHFVVQKYPGRDQVRAVAEGLAAGPGKLSDIALRAGVPQKKAQVVLVMLEEQDLAKEDTSTGIISATGDVDETTVWRAAEAYRKKREGDRERLQAMLDYANLRSKCRVQSLMGYFGDEPPVCGKCDICTGKYGDEFEAKEQVEDQQEERELPNIPEAPPPPRKDPTTMF